MEIKLTQKQKASLIIKYFEETWSYINEDSKTKKKFKPFITKIRKKMIKLFPELDYKNLKITKK